MSGCLSIPRASWWTRSSRTSIGSGTRNLPACSMRPVTRCCNGCRWRRPKSGVPAAGCRKCNRAPRRRGGSIFIRVCITSRSRSSVNRRWPSSRSFSNTDPRRLCIAIPCSCRRPGPAICSRRGSHSKTFTPIRGRFATSLARTRCRRSRSGPASIAMTRSWSARRNRAGSRSGCSVRWMLAEWSQSAFCRARRGFPLARGAVSRWRAHSRSGPDAQKLCRALLDAAIASRAGVHGHGTRTPATRAHTRSLTRW